MLDIKFICDNKEKIEKNCENRGVKCDIGRLLVLKEKKKEILRQIEKLSAFKNDINEIIKESKSVEEKNEAIEKGKKIKTELEKIEPEFGKISEEYRTILMQVPNMTHPDSPVGRDDSENKELEKYGEEPKFSFAPKTHEELGRDLDIIDFERAAKVSGAKFYFLKNEGALLEFALIQYAFEKTIERGFIPFTTPDLAKDKVLEGIGFNPRGPETQAYSVEGPDLSLVGTAEITMGGYHMDEIIPEEKLPLKYVAFSHCFRTEAGSYGRHSSGLYRVHQFSKVEMFAYTLPEKSEKMHAEIKNIEVEIFKGLGIPFRVVDICTGDLGGPAFRKYDLEAWMVSKNGWGEVTSTSDTTTYQARRLNVRVKRRDGTKEFLHMLNGTGVAVSRSLIAILENFQQADGSVKIPEVLQKYMPGNLDVIKKKW
jgi:seryl-tRNA synthetase